MYFDSHSEKIIIINKNSRVSKVNIGKMEITNVTEYEPIAKEKLPKMEMVYDYYAPGAEDQWTLKENQNAFSRSLHSKPRLGDLGL